MLPSSGMWNINLGSGGLNSDIILETWIFDDNFIVIPFIEKSWFVSKLYSNLLLFFLFFSHAIKKI
jgi:hypothetical protein